MSKRLGWRCDLCMDELFEGSGLRVERQYKLKKVDFWKIVFATNVK